MPGSTDFYCPQAENLGGAVADPGVVRWVQSKPPSYS